MSPALPFVVEPSMHAARAGPKAGSGIDFTCKHCASSFVVHVSSVGAPLACRNCGKVSTVPSPGAAVAPGVPPQISQLQHQLKENESQRTEITGYINQLTIQLHRWQLRLQTLNERQKKLQAELDQTHGPS